MGASVRPESSGDRIARNIQALRDQGASEHDIETYLTEHEGLKPASAPPGFAAESTASRPGSAPPKSPGNLGSAIVRGIEQGATFGFADELASGIDALKDKVTGGPGYDARLAENRAKLHQSRADHPVATTTAEVAGGLLPIVASGGSSAPATLGRNIAAGAGYGALAGAGNAEGDLGSRAIGAGLGAATGGVLGGVLGTAVPAAGKAVARVVRPAPAVATPVMRTATGVIAPKEIGLAERKILEALQRDNVSLDRLGNEAAGVQRTGRGTDRALVDMGGKNLIGLGRAARNVPSEGKDRLESFLFRRQKQQLPGITRAMEEGTGQQQQNVVQTIDDLIAKRKADASPLYAKAYPQVVDDPEVIATLNGSPYYRQAHEIGRELAREEGVTLPPLTRDVMVGDEMVTEQVPQSVQAIDYTKRGLDALIERKSGAAGAMDRDLARVLRNKLRDMLGRVDEAVPEYGAARQAFRGPSEMIDAMNEGREFLKRDPREVEKLIANYSPSEQEAHRIGQLDAARQFMEKVSDTGDLAGKIMGNPAIRAKMRTMFPDNKSYVGYLREVLDRARMSRTKTGITGNSTTAQQLGEIADLAGVNPGELALEGAKAVATGGASLRTSFFKRAADYLEQKRSGVQGNVADAIARDLLTKPTDPAFQQLLARLTEAERAQLRRQFLGNATASRAAGEYGGGSTSRALTSGTP